MAILDRLSEFQRDLRVPAVGAALAGPKNSFNFEVAGSRRRDVVDPVAADDQWHIGSCSKSITAILYARLVTSGAAAWGVPIAKLLPDIADNMHPDWTDRTIDDLFHCRSGMAANLTPEQMRKFWQDTAPLAEQRTEAALAALSRRPAPRGQFIYSNLGYIVIGAAIDRLTKSSFETALEKHVWEPLEITSAGFGPPSSIRGHGCRLRLGSLMLGRGRPADPADAMSDNPAVMNSAGRIHLTLTDWSRVQRVFLRNGSFLDDSTLNHILQVPDGGGTPMAMGWARTSGLEGVGFGMQGSNTMWSATALLSSDRDRLALVTCNDGRTRVLQAQAKLAAVLLSEAK